MQELFYRVKLKNIEKVLKLPGNTIKVYLALIRHADITTGICWPGYRKLEELTGISSHRRMREHLDELVDDGLIERWENGNKLHYRVI